MNVHEVEYVPAQRAAVAPERSVARWEKFKTLTRRARFGMGVFGDPRLLAYYPLMRYGMRLASQHPFDLIVATAPPEVTLMVARTLGRRTRTPWVADFRDLWFRDMLLYRTRLAAWLAGPLNRWLVAPASVLVTVSRGLQERVSGYLGREVLVSYNGFFRDEHPAARSLHSDGRRHIVYTGRLYPGKRDPEPLFRALNALRATMPDLARRLSVDFYGFDDPWLRTLIERHAVGDCVTLHGFVPYRDSIALQRAADALLFLDWMSASAEGVLTGKLFEYLGSARPILVVGPSPETEAARLVAAAGAGRALTTDAQLVDYLRGIVLCPRAADLPRTAVERFSRDRQAAELLENITRRLDRPAGGRFEKLQQ